MIKDEKNYRSCLDVLDTKKIWVERTFILAIEYNSIIIMIKFTWLEKYEYLI